LPVYRLTGAQRDKLAGFVSLTEERELCRLLGMTPNSSARRSPGANCRPRRSSGSPRFLTARTAP